MFKIKGWMIIALMSFVMVGCKDDLSCECVMHVGTTGLISTNFEVNTIVDGDVQDSMFSMSEGAMSDKSKYLGPYIFTIDGKCSFITIFERSNSDTTDYYSSSYDASMNYIESDRARNCIKLAKTLNYINL